MKEIYRGHLEECWQHFRARFLERYPKGIKGGGDAKKPTANFIGVSPYTVTVWLHRHCNPEGEQHLKLMCYLELNGYKIIELERLKPVLRNIVSLIGYGLLPIETVSKQLGFSNPSSLSQVIKGDFGTSDVKEQKMLDIWKAWRDRFEARVQVMQSKYLLEDTPNAQTRSAAMVTSVRAAPGNCPRVAAVRVAEALLVLLDGGTIQGMTESEWSEFQQENSSTFLRLSSHLSKLSARLVES